MTREHLFFIPFIFSLGFVVGALVTRERPREAANGRQVVVAGLIVLLVFVATHALSTHGGARQTGELLAGQPIFDQRPSFSAAEVYERIVRFGEAGRDAYRRMTYTSDLAFPLALFYFLFSLARYVTRQVDGLSPRATRLVILMPFLWLATDLAENAIVFTLLRDFPARNDALAGILGVVTDTKFTLLVASVVALAVLMAVKRRRVDAL